MVKFLVFIFSIYMLVLPGVTCAETDACSDDMKDPVTQTAGQSGHEDEKDDCGSFCTCSCCVHIVSLHVQSPKIVTGRSLAKDKQHFFYNNISLPSNYFGNIWQPPKCS